MIQGHQRRPNCKYAQSEELITAITARSNIKREEIIQLGLNRYAFVEDMPDGMSIRQYRRLLEHRSQTEAIFSPFSTVFDMKRMNSIGQAAAMIHICKYLSLLLLHALSAYKVNAPRSRNEGKGIHAIGLSQAKRTSFQIIESLM